MFDRHHHRAKHHGGWTVHQPSPGRFAFRTRAGVHHITTPRRILEPAVSPRPAVRSRPLPDDAPPDTGDDDPTWRERYLRRTGSTPVVLARVAPVAHLDDDPPPF